MSNDDRVSLAGVHELAGRIDNLESAFRELRAAWFMAVVYKSGQDPADKVGKLYDAQTEAIIRGESAMVAPQSISDLEEA